MNKQRKTVPAIYLCGMDDRVFPDDTDCPSNAEHTPMPRGFIERADWAERMLETHDQQRCPACGRWALWVSETQAPEPKE